MEIDLKEFSRIQILGLIRHKGCILNRRTMGDNHWEIVRNGGSLIDGAFKQDLTGAEAFYNHYHPDDLIKGGIGKSAARLKVAQEIGKSLAHSWCAQLKAANLRQKARIYYCDGIKSPTVRFHIIREGECSWLNTFPPNEIGFILET